MDIYGRVIFTILGLSSTLIICVPTLKRRQTRRDAQDRLKMVSAALVEAEERTMRVQERHDKLLAQICSYYLCHTALEEAIVGARKAMDEELEFVSTLRKLQLWILATFPDHVDLGNALS